MFHLRNKLLNWPYIRGSAFGHGDGPRLFVKAWNAFARGEQLDALPPAKKLKDDPDTKQLETPLRKAA